MDRVAIINHLINKYNYSSYLEIGVQAGISFKGVNLDIKQKVGVDPDPHSKATLHLTSDDFFKYYPNLKFDIIFIDGLHNAKQVERDINNSLHKLNFNGTIICHDCLPPNEESQIIPRQTRIWTGDCWKAFLKFRNRPDLEMYTVDTDFGCGIIRIGKNNNPLKKIITDYKEFDQDRKNLMNIIPVDEFIQIF